MIRLFKYSNKEYNFIKCDKNDKVKIDNDIDERYNDMRVKRYFAPHLISTNYFAAKAAPVILKHSESADLLRKSLLPHVLRVPRSFTYL